jgi:hypothetical protein
MKKYNVLRGSINLNTTSAGILKIRLIFGPKMSSFISFISHNTIGSDNDFQDGISIPNQHC